ncbi:hypothetical protein [Dyadobacter pollutisoli]|uniref:Uncharacterized protein n=1 Tax=Dyadobacter pollutisoli TaxID=2910158 RepID=A0A9E8SJT6_9BACT|nr:hypothetical protein [Dyadobacter pollutisoli]WAC10081.1 hypothetical protein ON006_20250 [Dyadobacter pollutisoli]
MNKIAHFLVVACCALKACAPKTTGTNTVFRANPLPDSIKTFILQPDEILPGKSEFLREVVMGASLLSSNCGYKNLMDYATFQSRQSGANLIQLTQVKKPAMGNGCYHITARLYKNLDSAAIASIESNKTAVNKSTLPSDADYAIVHFYRPKAFEGAIISYQIKMDDKGVIGKASAGSRFEYKITEFGKHRFFGKTKKQDAVTFNIEKGKEYYVRCGVTKGSSIVIPDMYLMENYVARRELAEL